ncbi:uncharacterized protein LOC130761436 [Actinidia eriantha]|uniref:uncharacterized protein LOC130761436 n=1 Tax=Actinidia eriantha TaxID=165200 RepID=UPI00258D6E43|nr:uncharacterized protein LOC130761436 [Actinidia eriantha]
MDESRRSQVPAFGSWECEGDFPFTQCFDSARQPGLVRYSTYCEDDEDGDLYVPGDLYDHVAMPKEKSHYRHVREEAWVVCEIRKEPPSPVSSPPPPPSRKAPKPVDEDLYNLSPEVLHSSPKRKRGWGFFSSCLMLTWG